MKIRRVGKDYKLFFNNNVNKKKFINNQDGFNMSMINIKDDIYMFAVRYLGFFKLYYNDKLEIIPGNYSSYNTEKKREKLCSKIGNNICDLISFGKNFFWGSWNTELNDNTILFIGKLNHDTLKITPIKKYKPYVISNLKHNNIKYKYSDVRLIKIDNKYYCYDGYVRNIYNITITNNSIVIKKHYNINYLDICKDIIKYDKNWSYWKYEDNNMIFLNWYEDKYVTITKFNKKTGKCIKENLVEMKKDLIPGLGNKKLPMFSFGTPFVEINKNEWISAGHIKIISFYKYDNKKLLDFRKSISKREKYNYINLITYYYLTYYILIKKINNKYKMFISDAYLYLLPKEKYVFSINFPMGISTSGNNVFISLGIGDYYNSIIKYDKTKLKKLCIHNVEKFDSTKYNYHIIDEYES
jgi:hypothetical protein